MSKRVIFFIALFLSPAFFSCDINEDEDTDDTEEGINLAEGAEDASDYQFTESEATVITLNGSSATVSGDGASVSGATVTISSPGNYKLTGTLTNGQIVVKAKEEGTVRLILNGVTVSNSSTSPLFVDSAEKVVLVLNEGTTNTFTDGTSYSDTDEGQNAAIYSQAYLSVYGTGKLIADGNYADGIGAKDGMVIKSGTIEVTAVDDGIRGKDYLLIHDANVTVNCGGDGLKSDNETDTSLGYVYIEAGSFNITAGADGISAQTALVTKEGQYTVTSGGGSSRTVSATLSAKAIKAGGAISLTGTSFNLSAAEDGIHSD
ncbi:MAG: carbohydrate-binding domain-containing protein, partial [Prolixibacteraceae bacterium]